MRKSLCVFIALAAVAADARDIEKVKALPVSAAAALSGKVLAVTRHEPANFAAATADKAMMGMLGAFAMTAVGNQMVKDNQIADPVDTLEAELAPAVSRKFGMTLKPGSVLVDGAKPKGIVAAQPGADYILDLLPKAWGFNADGYRDSYWIKYMVEARLFDKSAKQLSKMMCFSDTYKHPNSPGKDEMLANNAQLLKDVTASLGWRCLQRIATQQFGLTGGEVTATPADLADPLASRLSAHEEPSADSQK